MKTRILLSLILLAMAFSAKAGNEGAQATPQAPTTVLAEYVQSGGFFVPPGGVASKRYQILSSGTVQMVSFTVGSDEESTLKLKDLSVEELAHVKSLVDSVVPGELVDPTPNAPGCWDAPSFRYVVHSGADEIIIGQTIDCKTMTKANETQAELEIMKILADIKNSADSSGT